MAVAQAPRAHFEPAPKEPSFHVGVMGMYIFLASEVMFFGSLFAVYAYLFASHGQWPPPGTKAVEYWPLPTINTAVLLSSGITCHFGLEALRHGSRLGKGALVAAGALAFFGGADLLFAAISAVSGLWFEVGLALFGAIIQGACIAVAFSVGPFGAPRMTFYGLWIGTILLGVAFEAGQAFEFATAHIKLTTNQFASAFFTMTGFHGGHVAGGLILLTLVLGRALKGQFDTQHHVGPAAITLYWHFVDLVWIFLYGILYFAIGVSASAH
ncbi:MAG: heme-copper oxidase subunit III [Candidatus Dormibacteraeota bacterium]|uniref:Heme-copper oxidase subunit III n=1 Tax=Candidatus Dormiibacter inghamiae TaxID=3127013 RepID=A0A934KF69_9BACT|nr:heme-copper oxidase subunit III [Candidatus Dormibacteraeota bacterium]MBJ7606874.1 heme-copper oxidase subunit III [Candidatus Dormibacteraeota bacterium]PZR69675.1 MAG: hypothetical protein DLM66_05600 [Candidatus Dormibacteraeota bacterium]